MSFIMLTRPDGNRIALNTESIISVVEAPPANSPVAGPASAQTRITFANQTHQDVREALQEVLGLITRV